MMLNGGECPSLETIGAFVDGRFKDREREVIADHLASCETCYFVFSEAARTRVTALPASNVHLRQGYGGQVRAFVPRLTWKMTTGLAAAAVLVLAVNIWRPFGPADQRALDDLVAAVGTGRTFEARLTGGFAYAPVRGPVRGPNDAANLPPDVRIAIAEIEKQFTARPIAATAALIGGDTTRAISILEAAAQTDPNNPRILSDLSAAHLVLAQRNNSKEDASRALAMANRALESDRLMPEALFNRALALEISGLREDARAAWQAYLTIDDRSGWADEARARLRILATP
jgi:tetratricopeptide (TPR) repeat protein